jgi:hypothetical protein
MTQEQLNANVGYYYRRQYKAKLESYLERYVSLNPNTDLSLQIDQIEKEART